MTIARLLKKSGLGLPCAAAVAAEEGAAPGWPAVNCALPQRCGVLMRKSCSFSKSLLAHRRVLSFEDEVLYSAGKLTCQRLLRLKNESEFALNWRGIQHCIFLALRAAQLTGGLKLSANGADAV